MWSRLQSDINCILERDPAARSRFEVLTCYPGLHALVLHRFAHACWNLRLRWLGRFTSHMSRWLTGIEIHPAARIGERVFFDHAMGVVVGETAEIGDGCTIYQGVTLGGTSLFRGAKRHPTLGRNVVVGAGAKVLGGFTVGDGARIGSNAVLTKPLPAGATAVGNPARIILSDASPLAGAANAATSAAFSAYGITASDDPLSQALRALVETCNRQEQQIAQLCKAVEALSHGDQPSELPRIEDSVGEEAQKLSRWIG